MRAEIYSLLADLPEIAQAENLKTAGVCKQRSLPAHEFVESTQVAHQLVPGAQIEMVGVAENDLRAQLFQHILRNALHRSSSSHRHEDRRLHLAVGGNDPSRACSARLGIRDERQCGHLSALRLIQCRTRAYLGIAVGEFFVTCTRPLRFKRWSAACTADFESPVPSASRCRLAGTCLLSARNNSAQRKTYTRKAAGERS